MGAREHDLIILKDENEEERSSSAELQKKQLETPAVHRKIRKRGNTETLDSLLKSPKTSCVQLATKQ